MTLTEAFALVSFSLFSFADLRYRLVPGIEVFLFGTVLLTLPVTPIQTGIVVLACAWGIFRNISGWLALPLLFYPSAWPVLLTGYGYRRGIVGRADLLAITGLACLFPLPAVLFALLGLEVWRKFWIRRQTGSIPALPGLLLGLIPWLLLRLFFQTL
ncbi:MAG TPA: hypothetical protein VJ972_13180 [Anaerolineales bacterium]|nr:hypothetical protein [Anaerolineales bacterium]